MRGKDLKSMHESCESFLMILFELIAVELKKRSTKFAGSPEGQEKRGILLLSYFRAMLTFRAGFTHDGSRANHAVRRKS